MVVQLPRPEIRGTNCVAETGESVVEAECDVDSAGAGSRIERSDIFVVRAFGLSLLICDSVEAFG